MKKIEKSVIERYRDTSTGTVGHFLDQGFLDWRIQCLYRPVKVVGQAITVSSPPTDNSIFREALNLAQPGDVLVIERAGDQRHASWGGILSLAAKLKGLAGVVIDGAATDWAEITEMQFPVYCKNLSALTTRKQDLGGRLGEPISCGGVPVATGDLVLGDEDGVVVVPFEQVDDVLVKALAKEAQEAKMRELLHAGLPLAKAAEEARHLLK